jgi:hypothetical protein
MKTFCIKNQADLAQIPNWDAIQLEIYLPNAILSLREINGNCLIRAENCYFPHLETVHGDLSIDAAGASCPHLEQVEGDCNVHEARISLPKLAQVRGSLKILEPIHLLALEKVGNKLENKAKVPLPKLISTNKPIIEIKNKSDVARLPADGYFSLVIHADDITIYHQVILGNILIKGSNIHFPNLVEVRKLLIGESNQRKIIHNFFFPSLTKVHENCIICNSENVICEVLKEVGQKFIVDYQSTCFLYNLEKVGVFNCNSEAKLNFPKLKWVKGDFHYREVGKNHEDSDFPALESIHGTLHFSNHLRFPNLKTVRVLEVSQQAKNAMEVHLPMLETIKYALYNPLFGELAAKVEHLFFGISETVHVSSTEFIISSGWRRRFILQQERFPLSTLISILKMRHSSFQNFYTREFERLWLKPHPRMEEIAVIIEKKWHSAPQFTFKEIFALTNRNLRRFCFLYIGVSEMMKALEAQRIATKGIELNYFKYDSLGNKVPFTKHNIFEIYEASVSKLQDLQTWRSQNEKIYAVKCWCTSTNHEHWLWIQEQYKKDPLAAIASTFRIHENVIPHIKCLKRQGDVLICEMKREVIPSGAVRPLTKKEYFGLLEVET